MNRRDALARVALVLGGTVVGSNIFLEGCKPADKKAGPASEFSQDDIGYLDPANIAVTIKHSYRTSGAPQSSEASSYYAFPS